MAVLKGKPEMVDRLRLVGPKFNLSFDLQPSRDPKPNSSTTAKSTNLGTGQAREGLAEGSTRDTFYSQLDWRSTLTNMAWIDTGFEVGEFVQKSHRDPSKKSRDNP